MVYAAACNHMNSGGLSAYSSLPRCGNSQSPLSTMCLATSAKRGSSAGHGSRRPSPAPSTSSARIQNIRVSRAVMPRVYAGSRLPPLLPGDPGVEEAVHAVLSGQPLAAVAGVPAEARIQWLQPGIGRTRQESLDLRIVLAAQDRARRVQQGAAGCEGRPQRIEQLRLGRDEFVDVGGATMQEDVRLPADHAGRA